jgi:hypothetical protein
MAAENDARVGAMGGSVDRWRHQELVFQRAGQTLWYEPPEGAPSGTPTVEVIRAATGAREEALSGPCAVDAASTTLQQAAVSGQAALAVADGTGIARGRRYLLTNGEGDREWIEIHAIDGGLLATRRPILFSYPEASPLVGCRLSIAVDPAWAADRSKLTDQPDAIEPELAGYRLSWAYTVAGAALTGVSFADLVRRPALDLVTPADVDDRFPGWLARLPADHRESRGADLILEAFAAVRLDALGHPRAVRRIRDTGVLCELVKFRANQIAIEHDMLFGGASSLDLGLAEQRYRARRDQLLFEPGDASGAATRAGASKPR